MKSLKVPKRETIKSLDSKIKTANEFLTELSKKIEDREREIRDLKKVISDDRAKSNRSELEEILN